MIKAASVGLGWWSDELAKSIQGKSKKIKIVSCFSRSKKKRINFSKKFKTKYHNSYNNLIQDKNIDAILLTTPHSLHSQHAIQALKNGKHVGTLGLDLDQATYWHDKGVNWLVASTQRFLISGTKNYIDNVKKPLRKS